MNIEEAIKDIKRIINNPEFDYIVLMDSQGFTEWNDILETLLTAYEKEKRLAENHKTAFEKQTENLHEVEELYEKEKEKNKILLQCLKDSQERCENEHLFLGNPDM